MDPTPVVFRFLGSGPVLARRGPRCRLVNPKDERREHHFTTVGVAVGDGSGRRPIRMGVDGLDPAAKSRAVARCCAADQENTGTTARGCRPPRVRSPRRSRRSATTRASRISRRCCRSSPRTWRTAAGRPGRGRSGRFPRNALSAGRIGVRRSKPILRASGCPTRSGMCHGITLRPQPYLRSMVTWLFSALASGHARDRSGNPLDARAWLHRRRQ